MRQMREGDVMRDRPNDIHRTLTEQRLGRKLGPNEVVDHADEDKTNNSRANLNVQARGAHTTHHNKTRGLGRLRKALRLTQGKEKKIY